MKSKHVLRPIREKDQIVRRMRVMVSKGAPCQDLGLASLLADLSNTHRFKVSVQGVISFQVGLDCAMSLNFCHIIP